MEQVCKMSCKRVGRWATYASQSVHLCTVIAEALNYLNLAV